MRGCARRVNRREPLSDMRAHDFTETRREGRRERRLSFCGKRFYPRNKFREVLFERVPSIINLPGGLFRAIDVESADVLVPCDAGDMSRWFFRLRAPIEKWWSSW